MKVFVSSLGVMGRRHLIGAMKAGAEVLGFDPSEASVEKAKEAITKAGLDLAKVKFTATLPTNQSFDAAIFSETADFRVQNFLKFTETNTAKRIMLEKPVARGPADLEKMQGQVAGLETKGTQVFVNFPRRTWPFYMAMKERWAKDTALEMTLNGGAVGLGCNGIHYIDTFAFLSSKISDKFEVLHARGSTELIGSGRGERFKDYGGTFLLKKGPATFYLSIDPTGTPTPVLTFKSKNSVMWVDENNYTYREWNKTAGFEKPTYLYGQDYSILGEGAVEYRDLISLTQLWTNSELMLPKFGEVIESHHMLFALLKAANIQEPYLFT